jgi:hypothetical protein
MSENNLIRGLYKKNSGKHCVSCYKVISNEYCLCFDCHTHKNNLKQCREHKKDGSVCKNMTLKDVCYYHRLKKDLEILEKKEKVQYLFGTYD